MFNLRRPKATPKAKKLDTGRISSRNIVNAKTEASRQANWRKKFS